MAEQAPAFDLASREAQMFPHLPQDMVARIRRYGVEQALPAGTQVFQRHQRGVDLFVVLDGAIEIFDTDDHGHPRIITTHRQNQFTGELDLFNDREIIVSGRAFADTTVIRVHRADFRRLVSTEPDIGEIMMRAFILRRVGAIQTGFGGVALVGAAHAAHTLRLQRFLTRNAYPHRLLDTATDADADGFLHCFDLAETDLPVVVAPDRTVLRNPTNLDLANALGLTEPIDPHLVWDVAVIGAGPAGLASAVYAASEGLRVIVLESMAPGGQAGTSSKIENYLGFPTGISGQALAGRAQVQAMKFGAHLAIAHIVTGIDCDQTPHRLKIEDGNLVPARSIIIASGARYRKLSVPDYEKYEGGGIHYAATGMEAQLCTGEQVIVVGGGNSAGQAAVFLSRTVAHVHILVRAEGLAATMSDYLVQRIDASDRITLHPCTEITGLAGDPLLQHVTWRNCVTGQSETHDIGNLFAMIGAEPNADWLDGCVDRDAKGFIVTGIGVDVHSAFATSRPGIYAVGDVRAGSVKRVASAVGEGSVVVQAVHRYLNPGAA